MTACRSASSVERPSVATSGCPSWFEMLIMAASTPGIAPAASSVRESTSSRSIVPASSLRKRLRRPSSSALSIAVTSSFDISSMRAERLATSSATCVSASLTGRRSISSARSRTTSAPRPAEIAIRTVVTPFPRPESAPQNEPYAL